MKASAPSPAGRASTPVAICSAKDPEVKFWAKNDGRRIVLVNADRPSRSSSTARIAASGGASSTPRALRSAMWVTPASSALSRKSMTSAAKSRRSAGGTT